LRSISKAGTRQPCPDGFQIDSNEIRPVHDRKCVSIGDREIAAHEVLPVGELIVEPGEPLVDAGLRRILDVVRRSLVEQRGEALVQFGADEGEPLLQPVTIDSARGRSEPARGLLIRLSLPNISSEGELGQMKKPRATSRNEMTWAAGRTMGTVG
jgi:hypothetical protein